jgi:hypothetical protein
MSLAHSFTLASVVKQHYIYCLFLRFCLFSFQRAICFFRPEATY